MYIYNVTVSIDADVRDQWLSWMKKTHIPEVMRTGCFTESRILKVLYLEEDGHTYSIQYQFKEIADIEKYQKDFAPALQADHKKLFGEKYHAFRTVLEIVE